MQCPRCGNEQQNGNFCDRCGQPLSVSGGSNKVKGSKAPVILTLAALCGILFGVGLFFMFFSEKDKIQTQSEPDSSNHGGFVSESSSSESIAETTVTTTTTSLETTKEPDNVSVIPTMRLAGDNRYQTSINIANQIKKLNGNQKFKNIIIASGTGFTGALSSAYLAKVKDAPILIIGSGATNMIVNYVKTNAASDATIYIIGGEASVSKNDETIIKQNFKNVIRLYGKDRLETNLAVLKESGSKDDEIIIGNALGYADMLSASATGKPILITEGDGLTDKQKEYLDTKGFKYATIIGESDVVSEGVESDVKKIINNVDRVGKRTRFETSVLIAKKYFKNPPTISITYGLNYPDGLCGAPLSMKYGCPLILVTDKVTDFVKDYAKNNGVTSAVIYGSIDLIADKTVETILGK